MSDFLESRTVQVLADEGLKRASRHFFIMHTILGKEASVLLTNDDHEVDPIPEIEQFSEDENYGGLITDIKTVQDIIYYSFNK